MRFKNGAPFNSSRECCATATTKSAVSYFGNNITWCHAKCTLQTFYTAVCFVVLRRTRVDNTNTLIGDTLLALDPWKFCCESEAKWVSATMQHIGAQQTGNVVNKNWSVCNATFLGCYFDHWLEPQHAPRTVSHHAHTWCLCKHACYFVAACRARCCVTRYINSYAIAARVDRFGKRFASNCIADDGVDRFGSDATHQVPVDCNGWPKGAVAQAKHFFYNNGFAFAPVAFVPAERVAQPSTCAMQRP